MRQRRQFTKGWRRGLRRTCNSWRASICRPSRSGCREAAWRRLAASLVDIMHMHAGTTWKVADVAEVARRRPAVARRMARRHRAAVVDAREEHWQRLVRRRSASPVKILEPRVVRTEDAPVARDRAATAFGRSLGRLAKCAALGVEAGLKAAAGNIACADGDFCVGVRLECRWTSGRAADACRIRAAKPCRRLTKRLCEARGRALLEGRCRQSLATAVRRLIHRVSRHGSVAGEEHH